MTFRSPFVKHAIALRDETRMRYEELVLSHYARAERETNARLLNERGMKQGVDSLSLFSGPWSRAKAYASEELIEHWQRHPRLSFEDFEHQSFADWLHHRTNPERES